MIKKSNKYIITKRFGTEKQKAFNLIKEEIVKLIEAGANNDFSSISKNMLSNMFKSKLYYLYYPHQVIPIFSD